MRRAMMLAALAPSSVRTMCSAASMPAAVPAPVTTWPSCTKSTSGSTSVSGNSSASWSVYIQWVVARRPSSTPAWPSTNAPLQTLEHPGAAGDGVADDLEVRARRAASSMSDAGTATRSASAATSRSSCTTIVKPSSSAIGPGSAATTWKSKVGPPCRRGRCRTPRRSRRTRTAPSAGGRCRRCSGARDPPNGRNGSFGGDSATRRQDVASSTFTAMTTHRLPRHRGTRHLGRPRHGARLDTDGYGRPEIRDRNRHAENLPTRTV